MFLDDVRGLGLTAELQPVTITLRKGDPQNLQTVSTLTSKHLGIENSKRADSAPGTGSDGYFLWTPDSSLATGSDYALQITQGQSDINYSGPFAVIGGTGSSSISYSATSSLSLTSASMNSTITSVTTPASMGTGVSVSRNTTFSSQTLASTSPASRTSSRSATTSGTAAETAATSAPTSAATQVAGSLALILGLVAALVFLN
jgi:Ser-Thr-rich glycosyl-phosphatidyl-inositol-anchored membrane family